MTANPQYSDSKVTWTIPVIVFSCLPLFDSFLNTVTNLEMFWFGISFQEVNAKPQSLIH